MILNRIIKHDKETLHRCNTMVPWLRWIWRTKCTACHVYMRSSLHKLSSSSHFHINKHTHILIWCSLRQNYCWQLLKIICHRITLFECCILDSIRIAIELVICIHCTFYLAIAWCSCLHILFQLILSISSLSP